MPPQLIVGLGNPGTEYAATRHNAGFMVVDRLLARSGATGRFRSRFGGQFCKTRIAGRTVCLLKPMSYMNRSGESVRKAAAVLEVSASDILVCFDCLDLPLGKIRLRQKGSSGGHRGVESIIQCVGSAAFLRLRVGIGRPAGETVGYVLSGWSTEEMPLVTQVIDTACDALIVALKRGAQVAMNQFNSWQPSIDSPSQADGTQGEQN